MRVLLCTHSIGCVFDDLDNNLAWWLDALDEVVTTSAADFVAVHLQELTGSLFVRYRAPEEPSMDTIARLSEAVRARFHDFWCSGILCSPVTDASDFTALGCVFLVRRSKMRDVSLFEFGSPSGGSGWKSITLLDEPLLPAPGLSERWCRHSSFPRHFFGELVPELTTSGRIDHQWTRNGWLHTRWSIEGQPLELLNVALPGDEDNLHALHRTASLSAYANSRQDALKHALEMLNAAGPPAAALGPLPPALCVFGELNFRLDVRMVLAQLAGQHALSDALSSDARQGGGWHGGGPDTRVALPLLPVAPSRAGLCSSLARCVARPAVVVEARRFVIDDVGLFATGSDRLRLLSACDVEAAACARWSPALVEPSEPTFAPTHSYALGATSSAALPAFDCTRCPSWCDRVLLNPVGMRLLRAASDVRYSALEQEGVVRSEHSLVHLAFTLGAGMTVGHDPLNVRVLARVAADSSVVSLSDPAPWRLKEAYSTKTSVAVES